MNASSQHAFIDAGMVVYISFFTCKTWNDSTLLTWPIHVQSYFYYAHLFVIYLMLYI